MGIKSGPPVEPLLLNKAEVESLFSWKEAVEVDDEVYKACGLGEVFHPDIGIFNFMPEGEAGINEIIVPPFSVAIPRTFSRSVPWNCMIVS